MTYARFLLFNLCLLFFGGFGVSYVGIYLQGLIARNPNLPSWLRESTGYLNELGMAFTIAVFLNVITEYFTSRRLHVLEREVIDKINGEAAKDLLLRVFNENLPSKLVEQIRTHLLSPGICKVGDWGSHYQLKYVGAARSSAGPAVTWTAEDSYCLKNMDRRRRHHDVAMEVEVPPGLEAFWDIQELWVQGVKVPIKPVFKDGRLRVSHSVILEPRQELKIKTLQKGAGSLEYSEIICSALPADRLVVSAVFDEQLEVNATSLHPSECQEEVFNQKREWTLEGVLPGQGMQISWKHRNSAS